MPSGEPVGDLNDLASLTPAEIVELGPLTNF